LRPPRILFLTAPIGAGHTRAAQAVSKALGRLYPGCEMRMANIFDFFHPVIGKTILLIYLKILSVVPRLYGSMYGWGNDSRWALRTREFINSYLAKRMRRFITDYNPNIIVCTHATPAGIASCLRKEGSIDVPVLAVVTDFVVHKLWVYPTIDYYYVAGQPLRDYLNSNGVPYDKSLSTGIPVDSDFFSQKAIGQDSLSALGLNANLPIILIMGGGAGVLPMAEIIMSCQSIEQPIQIIAVAGHNKTLFNQLTARQPEFKHCVRILGYVNNIPELMSAAQIIISKPGGMTSAEALCAGVPMIIYKPIPGQEEANTSYLVAQQVAEQVDSLEELQASLKRVLNEKPDDKKARRQRSLLLSRPYAADEIAGHILKLTLNGQA